MQCPDCKVTMIFKSADDQIPHDRHTCPKCLREIRASGPVKESGVGSKKTLLD
jgi:DNA-directed RNA polymerase subunit M/transcription elongation factor TFIIS